MPNFKVTISTPGDPDPKGGPDQEPTTVSYVVEAKDATEAEGMAGLKMDDTLAAVLMVDKMDVPLDKRNAATITIEEVVDEHIVSRGNAPLD